MGLRSTPVNRSLDRKLKIWIFEIVDLLVIFLLLSVLQFLFAGHPNKSLLTWGPFIVAAIGLGLSKKGKPDNYLLHWFRFKIQPRYLSAFKKRSNSTMKVRYALTQKNR